MLGTCRHPHDLVPQRLVPGGSPHRGGQPGRGRFHRRGKAFESGLCRRAQGGVVREFRHEFPGLHGLGLAGGGQLTCESGREGCRLLGSRIGCARRQRRVGFSCAGRFLGGHFLGAQVSLLGLFGKARLAVACILGEERPVGQGGRLFSQLAGYFAGCRLQRVGAESECKQGLRHIRGLFAQGQRRQVGGNFILFRGGVAGVFRGGTA